MKKMYVFIIALLVVGIIGLRPRHVVKEGYIFRTMHDVRYVGNVTQVAEGYYLPAHGIQEVIISFDEKHSYLYDSLKATTVLKVKFEGKYYPFYIHNTPMQVKFEPKLLLQNLIESEAVTQ